MSFKIFSKYTTISRKLVFNVILSLGFYFVYLDTSGNRTDDDNLSIMGPHFDEYPSGTG
jgi:hypothetical protein